MANVAPPPATGEFTPEQKQYLEGFLAAVAAAAPFVGTTASGQLTATPAAAQSPNLAEPPPEDTVFGTPLSELCKPERWKHEENPLDIWEKLVAHADGNRFPDEPDTFRFKFHGLFYVAPAQDSFMVRLRIPAGELTATQLHGIADLAADWGGGYAQITTRANLQVREIAPAHIVKVLVRLQELGLTSRGAGADNIRNITASPNSGFDPDELLDVRPHAKALHHYILNHRDLFGLPRKFNIAFDSGGALSTAADTNDLGFIAVRVTPQSLARATLAGPVPAPGIYFRVQLGGITGHKDFARDAGLLVAPGEVVAVAAAMVRVFNEHGCRTDRKKARLKYLLEQWGVERFVDEAARKLAFPLARLPVEACEPRRPFLKHGWAGVYRQAQRGFNAIGIGVPVGRLSAKQMHALADLATHYGQGELRLTVWENLILPYVRDAHVETACRSIQRLGLSTDANNLTSGIVSCTGNKGCKYAATDTKGHALALAKRLGGRLSPSSPVNLHFTGCPHSCAQHYCGDIGFLGAKLPDGREGYHVVLGGGMGDEQGIAREVFRGVSAEEIPGLVEHILGTYEARRQSGETFVAWVRRHPLGALQEQLER
ncbi:NirA family protein [Opitutus sp. ER46]|uniref:NirA family protein n=1 Tax=Opitutus sp. ER46 TaxID=2161864 RepID=UPI000D30FCE6|nr:NirA family protein [Opitutus sp. ER46]PTX92496.1 NirA family protein [Opitutus sp. ER46]